MYRDINIVFTFIKTLYKLKQVSKTWYNEMDNDEIDLGFDKSLSESIF